MELNAIAAQLKQEEVDTAARRERALEAAREAPDEDVPDIADLGQRSEVKDRQFADAEAAERHLEEVRAALARIDAGTYGLCLADGEPIEEERLRAVPWASYCLRHQEAREKFSGRPPTL